MPPKIILVPQSKEREAELRNKQKSPARCVLFRRTPAQAESLAAQFLGESGFRHGQTPSRVHLWPMQPLAAWKLGAHRAAAFVGELGRAPIPGLALCNAGAPAPSSEEPRRCTQTVTTTTKGASSHHPAIRSFHKIWLPKNTAIVLSSGIPDKTRP